MQGEETRQEAVEGVTHTCADPGSCSDRPGVGWVGSESSADRPAWLSWEPWLGHVLQQKSFGEKHEALVTEGCSEPPPVLPSTPSNVRLAVSERCLFGSPGYLQVAFPQALGSEACATTPDFGPDFYRSQMRELWLPKELQRHHRKEPGLKGGPSTTVRPELMSLKCPWLAQYVGHSSMA